MIKFVSGKKTYIVAGIMVIMSILRAINLIDNAVYEAVMGLLVALGFGSLRAGVEKIVSDCQEKK